MDYIKKFMDFAEANLCLPDAKEIIIADDKIHRFAIAGDKNGVKNASYQLKIETECAVGWIRNFKTGNTHAFISTNNRKMSAEEKKAYYAKIEETKRKQKEESDLLKKEAAQKAATIWLSAQKEGVTDYLTRKKCELNNTRISRGSVVVPIYINNKMTSLQFIRPDGSKRFVANGELIGGYYPLATPEEDKSVIVITEGFATADSIRRSTGFPVVVAFNANNLIAVTKIIKDKYPQAKIFIAADNDAYTTIMGKHVNVGHEKAVQAAGKTGGAFVVMPKILNDKNTDFNDVYCELGAEAVADYFKQPEQPSLPAIASQEEEVPEWATEEVPLSIYEESLAEEVKKELEIYKILDEKIDESWKQKLQYTDKRDFAGNPIIAATSLNNVMLFLRNHDDFRNIFCYDEFADQKKLRACPPWENPANFKVRFLENEDMVYIAANLERKGLKKEPSKIGEILSAIVKEKRINPAQEYFKNLVWDGVPRLDNWLITYCGATFDDKEYVQAIGRKWLIASVERVFNAGAKFDSMLVLEGKQEGGKSLILKELATFNNTSYFNDTLKVPDLCNEKNVPKLQGVLIVELQEMSGMNPDLVETLRQAITITTDRIVKKYANEPSDFPRRFVLAGTVNPNGSGYLHDTTGNRRFWCVKVADKINVEKMKRDKEQLWAEAVHYRNQGEKLFLEGHVKDMATNAQAKRLHEHTWQQDIESLTNEQDKVTADEIWAKLEIYDRTKRTKKAGDDITKMMTMLGFEKKAFWDNGKTVRGWQRTVKETEVQID
jgi:putative DNA primase/helicase